MQMMLNAVRERPTARAALFVAYATTLAGCTTHQRPDPMNMAAPLAAYVAMYGPHPDEPYPIPATDISRIDARYLRQEVPYITPEQPGTIVVDTTERFLYLVLENNRALRYGIGVGAEGMRWSGRAQVGRKAAWPRWTPTPSMIRRDPARNAPWANGMKPGLDNPLGPRALYLFQNGRDTLYRIHGTNEPHTIGDAVSSGCIRMLNADIIDLYRRVPIGARVLVRTEPTPKDATVSDTSNTIPSAG